MKALSMAKLLTCIVLFASILLVTACGGITIAPDGNGGVTVTPNENENNNGNGGNSGNTDGGNNGGGSGNNDSNNVIHSHVYELVQSDISSSCTEDVVRTWKCECGAEFTETFAAPGHDIRSYEGKAATCTEDGYKPYEKCIRGDCGYTTYEAIPATGHDLEYFVDIQPTCTAKGAYDRAECKREGCDYSTENVIAALGHIRQIVEGKPATCTEAGYLSYEICTRPGCDGTGIEKPTVIDALGHDDVHYSAKAPTCTEFGWNEYDVCHRCSRSTYEKIDANGHTYENGYCACGSVDLGLHTHIWNDGEIILKPTCTTSGMITYTCTDENCGDTKTDEISALGHNNQSYAAKAPTCTLDGWHAYDECVRCGYSTYSVDPALGHSYDNGTVTTKPTCTETGVRTFSCVRGDHSFNVEEEALGHSFGAWAVVIAPTCESWGQEQRVCSHDSSHIETRAIDMLGHDYGASFVSIEPKCTKNGEERQVCKNDSSHIIKTVIPALGHKDVDNTTGICPVCGEVVIPPLDTPVISHKEGSTVYWGIVEGADHYEVFIANSGNNGSKITTYNTFVDLKDYYGTNTVLQLFITAIPAENGKNIKSSPLQYMFDIPTGSMAEYSGLGLGQSVNLLTGSYTNYTNATAAGNSVSIFNSILFNRMDAVKNPITENQHDTEIIYSTSIESYTKKLTESIGNKFSLSGSVDAFGIAKATAGYSFNVESDYSLKTYNETQAIFYDMNYTYSGYQAEIAGFSDPQALSYALSDEFITDVVRLENGNISPKEFVGKYGTHVITSGIYGASFRAHYESLMSKDDAEETFGEKIEESISLAFAANIKGVKIEVDAKNEKVASASTFISNTDSSTQSKFSVKAIGGDYPVNMVMTSLADFSGVCENWAKGIEGSTQLRLIDVPNGSLFFVWDFLSDEHSEAKDILNRYFSASCDEQYYNLNGKINGMYKDFFDFDEETGTLTFDLSGLQEAGKVNTSLAEVKDKDGNITKAGVLYKDGDKEIFNGTTGLVTIYPKFSGHEIKKIVFEGGYLTRESQQDELIENLFEGIYIVFDNDWTKDIVVEFKNFAYEAPDGHTGLDFSAVSSENITVIATGNNYIKGGDCTKINNADEWVSTVVLPDGFSGINANKSNLIFNGFGMMEIHGGNGIDGTTVLSGVIITRSAGNGASGIIAKSVTVDMNNNLKIVGGNGGQGGHGDCGSENGSNGQNGMDGGIGGYGLESNTVILYAGLLEISGGNGGKGGSGGCCNPDWFAKEKGGNGGNGGSGGIGASSSKITVVSGEFILTGGNGGKGGDRGGIYQNQSNGENGSYGYGGSGGNATTDSCVIEDSNGLATFKNGDAGARGTGSDCRDH